MHKNRPLASSGIVMKVNGKEKYAKEVSDRVMSSGSYDEALQIIMEYVEME